MKVQNNIVLNSDLTAKYNDETDYLEILTNGNWQPGLYVGAKYYKIFEAGSILRWSLSLDLSLIHI